MTIRREPPKPPARTKAKITAGEAHLLVLRAAAKAAQYAQDLPVPHTLLLIGLLDSKPDPNSTYGFTAQDREDATAERSRLIYDVRVAGREGVMFSALVDARDGHLIQMRQQMFGAVGIPAGESKFVLPLIPFVHSRSWRIAEGEESWSKPVTSTLSPTSGEGFQGRRQILMTDGKVAFVACYDPASDRIGIEGADKKMDVYRLGTELVKLLKRRSEKTPEAGRYDDREEAN